MTEPGNGTAVAEVRERRDASPEQVKLATINRRLQRGAYLQNLGAVLPRGVTPERWVLVVLSAVNKNPQLLGCTEESIAEAALDVAKWGLELGRGAHIVPYGDKASAQVSWEGMIELSMRAGIIVSCTPNLVFEADEFDVRLGTEHYIRHVPAWQAADRGKPLGAYAVVTFPSGHRDFEVMNRAELEAIRDAYSKAYKHRDPSKRGPWGHPLQQYEMWKKTVIRRLHKRLPTPPLLSAVFEYDADERAESAESIMAASQAYRKKHGIPHVSTAGDRGYGGDDRPRDGHTPVNVLASGASVSSPAAETPAAEAPAVSEEELQAIVQDAGDDVVRETERGPSPQAEVRTVHPPARRPAGPRGEGYPEHMLQGSKAETPEQVEAAMDAERARLRERRQAEQAEAARQPSKVPARCAHDVPTDRPCVECEADARDAEREP